MNNALIEADPLSDGWDLNYKDFDGDSSAWSDEPQPFLAQALVELAPHSTVIDLGAGDGRNTRALIESGHRVTALDISESGLQLLARRLAFAGLPLPTPIVAKIERIPVASGHFDGAVAADVIPQIRDTRAAMEEIARILKPKGLLLLDVFTPRDCAFGQGEEIAANCFAYKGCLFKFFERGDLEAISNDLFEVVSVMPSSWWDPPHGAFRPYPHKHDALFYTLKKR